MACGGGAYIYWVFLGNFCGEVLFCWWVLFCSLGAKEEHMASGQSKCALRLAARQELEAAVRVLLELLKIRVFEHEARLHLLSMHAPQY